MSLETSRRNFLTAAGAAGLFAASGKPANALKIQTQDGRPLELQGKRRLATITSLHGESPRVQVEDSLEPLQATPRHFGDWEHKVGDRVFLVEEPGDPPVIEPLVKPVDAPLPVSVELGQVLWLGEISAKVTSREVVERAKEIRRRNISEPCHWLLIENERDQEYRVFGVVNRYGSTPNR